LIEYLKIPLAHVNLDGEPIDAFLTPHLGVNIATYHNVGLRGQG
jgi:hypothetical protein